MRTCTNCKESKPEEAFHQSGGRRHSWCAACFTFYRRNLYRQSAKQRQYHKDWVKQDRLAAKQVGDVDDAQ